MKLKAQIRMYAVYEGDKEVMRGNLNELAVSLHLQPQQVKMYSELGTLAKDKYIIRYLGTIDKTYYYEVKKKDYSKIENSKVFDYLYRHLEEYGNTCLNDDPSPYLPKLEEYFGKIAVRERFDKDDPYNFELKIEKGIKEYRRGRMNKYYILEVM